MPQRLLRGSRGCPQSSLQRLTRLETTLSAASFSLAWAMAHPEQVGSLTLLNTGALPGYRWHKFARIWRTPLLGELFQLTATRAAYRHLINADNPKPLPAAFIDRTKETAA